MNEVERRERNRCSQFYSEMGCLRDEGRFDGRGGHQGGDAEATISARVLKVMTMVIWSLKAAK